MKKSAMITIGILFFIIVLEVEYGSDYTYRQTHINEIDELNARIARANENAQSLLMNM